MQDIVYDRPKTLDSTFDAGGDTSSTLIAVSNMCEFINIQTILGGRLIKTKRKRTQIFPRELDYDAAIRDLWKFLVDVFKYETVADVPVKVEYCGGPIFKVVLEC